jgi:DNA-binding FadR family transcriptional regulator
MGPIKHETLAERAARALKRHILVEALKPGDQLPSERDLVDTLDVSRNVIREALRTLVAQGYIEKEAGRGAFVRPYDLQQLRQEVGKPIQGLDEADGLTEVRVALEIGALPFVVLRITSDELAQLDAVARTMRTRLEAEEPIGAQDREFHEILMRATHNEAFERTRRSILQSLRLRLLDPHNSMHHPEGRDANSVLTAEQTVRALERRDLEAAERAMRSHLTVLMSPGQARTFLFIDDGEIERLDGLTRTVNQANKHHHNPVIVPEKPWEGRCVFPSATVLYDEALKEYRMWYQGYRPIAPLEDQYSLCYAVSVDGVHWRKPELDIVNFEGSTDNNLLVPWGDPLRPDTMSATILHDPEAEDPGRRYTMVHFCHGIHPLGLGVAFSDDGLHWQPVPDNPVDHGGPEPIGDVLYAMTEPGIDRVAAYFRVRLRVRPRRTLARAESLDLIHWTGHKVILEADERDPPDAEMYGMTPFRYGNLILAFLWVATDKATKIEVQLACSRDGLTWERVGDRQPFLPRGPEGAFDAGVVARTTAPVVVGNEVWFYYMGAQSPPVEPQEITPGICLATLTMDRFVSLDAAEEEGVLITKPIMVADQTKLLLNAVVNPGGYVLVELLDGRGSVIEGFGRDDAIPFEGNAVFHPVCWRDRKDLSELEDQVLQLRFLLREARVYAFRLCQDDAATPDLAAIVC